MARNTNSDADIPYKCAINERIISYLQENSKLFMNYNASSLAVYLEKVVKGLGTRLIYSRLWSYQFDES